MSDLSAGKVQREEEKAWRGKKCFQGWRNEYCFIAVQYPVLQQYKSKVEKETSPPLDTTTLLLRNAGSDVLSALTVARILALGSDAV
jgi:hypothetical protein